MEEASKERWSVFLDARQSFLSVETTGKLIHGEALFFFPS
jgi:hypothetical protein